MISLLAKTEVAVPRVVARLNNPKNEWLFDQAWGVDVSSFLVNERSAGLETELVPGARVDVLPPFAAGSFTKP